MGNEVSGPGSGDSGKVRSRRRAVTLQARLKMSESQKRNWRDPQHREKIVRAIRKGMAKKKNKPDSSGASRSSTSTAARSGPS